MRHRTYRNGTDLATYTAAAKYADIAATSGFDTHSLEAIFMALAEKTPPQALVARLLKASV